MPRQISEENTCKEMIDPSTRLRQSGHRRQLEQAGWYLRDHSKVKIEIPADGYDAEPWNGEVLAVVEARKTAVDVRLAEAQLTHYVTEFEKHQPFRPFGFRNQWMDCVGL